jgi:hypothetical protein
MPKKNIIMEGQIPRTRCDKRLEDEARECACLSMMDLAEYIRAAIREKNEKVKAK